MDTRDAWNRMDSGTRDLVLKLWQQYQSTGSESVLRELREIFRNHGDDDPTERTFTRVLR